MSKQPNPLDALDDLIGAVPGPPQWSATDAAAIPRLLAEIDTLRAALVERDATAKFALGRAQALTLELNRDKTAWVQREIEYQAEIARLRAALERKE